MEALRGSKRQRMDSNDEAQSQPEETIGKTKVREVERRPESTDLLPQTPSRVPKHSVPQGEPGTEPGLPPAASFSEMIAELDSETMRQILVRLASISPSVQSAIKNAYNTAQHSTGAGEDDIDFDKYSKKVWHVLNTSEYARRSAEEGGGSKEEGGGNPVAAAAAAVRTGAWGDIFLHVTRIDRETRAGSSYATKQSALETLRKMLKSLLLSQSSLSKGIRSWLRYDNTIPRIMIRVLGTMSEEERVMVGTAAVDEKGSLATKVIWVRDEARKLDLGGLSELDDVLELMNQGDGTYEDIATAQAHKD
jgi:hypothetical protein